MGRIFWEVILMVSMSRESKRRGGYKGIANVTEYMVNSLDWLYTRIYAEGEQLDLAVSKVSDFTRVLDMKTGLLSRSLIWHTAKGALKLQWNRLISMEHIFCGAQQIQISTLDFAGTLRVVSGLDFNVYHGKPAACLWKQQGANITENQILLAAKTLHTGMEVTGECFLSGSLCQKGERKEILENRLAAITYTVQVQPGEELELQKRIYNTDPLLGEAEKKQLQKQKKKAGSFEELLTQNRRWWKRIWEKSDIEIQGDAKNQQGIRFCIFQMYQTYHGAVAGTNIGAKGLTGEAYNGNAFWDTETYCLPFFLFHDPAAARNLLYFRYVTLGEAKKRAGELDCRGAFYPVATISGRECCNLWQHASLQLQASTAVAYGIWCYEHVLQDREFTTGQGLEMLIEICRMLADRGAYNSEHTCYGYYGVMGPDEFQMMVNHNCYTNYMAKFTFHYTLDTLTRLQKEDAVAYQAMLQRMDCTQAELEDWSQKKAYMLIPYEEKSGIYEQHKGFFDLPHIDVDEIPTEEFPLYSHWTYDRIYRNDMIKQPDVLMFLFLFNSQFSEETIRKNYEFYEPRCIHESSLSPSVHSILASQLQKHKEACDFFQFATRMDLDNYNRNTEEGLHTTSIAAAWMNIVYGFGGMRTDGELLTFRPSIPQAWKGYSYRISYRGQILLIQVSQEEITLQCLSAGTVRLRVYDQIYTIGAERTQIRMPDQWRG